MTCDQMLYDVKLRRNLFEIQGFLYAGSAQRMMTELLVGEVSRRGHSVHGESYALAAGFALGFVCLGAGCGGPPPHHQNDSRTTVVQPRNGSKNYSSGGNIMASTNDDQVNILYPTEKYFEFTDKPITT